MTSGPLKLLRLVTASILTLAVLLTTGCAPRTSSPGGKTLLVFKHSKLFGDPEPLRALLNAFERQHPQVEVREETLPSSSDDQHQFYAINLQAQSAAFDVLAIDVIWVAEFARAGWLRDLSALLPASARQEFFAAPIAAAVYDERAYAIPWFVDAGLLYYRKDLLERYNFAPPKTWNDLVHIAGEIKHREPGMQGFVWQGKQYEGLVCNALEYVWSNGGDVLVDGRPAIDSESNREALRFMAGLAGKAGVTPDSVTTATEEPSRHVFGQGRAVFLRNWPYAWNLFQQAGSPVKDKVGIAVLPHFPGHASASTLGGWHLAVNRWSKHAEDADALIAYLTSAESQRQLALAYGFQPSRRALYSDPELLARHPFLATLAPVFASARARPVSPDYVRLSLVLQSEFSAIVSGVRTPEQALSRAQRDLVRIISDEH
jgi:multiple sugar transport system substrate-binding protein